MQEHNNPSFDRIRFAPTAKAKLPNNRRLCLWSADCRHNYEKPLIAVTDAREKKKKEEK